MSFIPKPPDSRDAVEYVVIVFVVTVASILVLSTLSLIVVSTVFPERDYSSLTGSLLDIVTTIIGALIGFIAGKGQGKAEAHEQISAAKEAKRVDDAP